VPPPSTQFREFDEGDFRISVPANWDELAGSNTVTFAPQGAYGQGVFTHGVEIGTTRYETHDIEQATSELIDSLRQSNPNLRQTSRASRATVSGRRGLQTTLSNVSDASGDRERIHVVTVPVDERNLFYVIAVAPESEASEYSPTFQRVLSSIRLE
jgi:hypothetical protein